MTTNPSDATVKTAAALLIASSLLSVLFMTHHPTLGAPGHETLAHEATHEAGVNGFVHGSLILLSIGYYICLSAFSGAFGRRSMLMEAGIVSFAAATITMCGAALVSGFIVPQAAASFIRAGMESDFDMQLRMLRAFNQTLANTGTIAYGFAIILWSAHLVALKGAAKLVGALGLPLGAAIAGGIITGALELHIPGMTLVVVGVAGWFIALSALMLTGRAKGD